MATIGYALDPLTPTAARVRDFVEAHSGPLRPAVGFCSHCGRTSVQRRGGYCKPCRILYDHWRWTLRSGASEWRARSAYWDFEERAANPFLDMD